MFILPKPFDAGTIVGTHRSDFSPETLGVISLQNMRELVDHNIVQHMQRGDDQLPAKVHAAVLPTRTPAFFCVRNFDASDFHTTPPCVPFHSFGYFSSCLLFVPIDE